MVDKVLDDTSRALRNLATRYGIEEVVVETYVLALKPQMQALTVAVGDINEQAPPCSYIQCCRPAHSRIVDP